MINKAPEHRHILDASLGGPISWPYREEEKPSSEYRQYRHYIASRAVGLNGWGGLRMGGHRQGWPWGGGDVKLPETVNLHNVSPLPSPPGGNEL